MDLFTLQSLFTLFLISIAIYIFISIKHKPPKKTPLGGPRTHPLLGILLDFLKNKHRFLEWVTEVLADSSTHTMVFKTTPWMVSGIFTANPLNVEHVLKNNFDNYPKGDRNFALLKDFLGHGIFSSDGESWRSQRKTASFEFNKRSLRSFVVDNVQFEIVHRLLPLLNVAEEEGRVLDLQDVLQRFAFDNICKVAFNVDPASLAGEGADRNVPPDFMEAFDDAAQLSSDRFFVAFADMWKVKKLLNIGSERRLRESVRVVHDFAAEIVRSRRKGTTLPSQSDDLLSRFASREDNPTDGFLRDMVVNFLLAGRETTSSSLTWFFWLLSTKPDVEKKVLEEIRHVKAKNPKSSGTMFGFEELREMNYLHAAISEAMRLYPPVPLDTQHCRDGDVLPDGTFVGMGWFVTYSAYSMGRMESIWGEDCCEFRPERWLVDGVFQPESPFKFTAFHAGPRMCLGKEMAYIQMKSIAACVLQRFEVVVVKEKPPEHLLALTLRMKGGLPIQVRKRRY